MTEMAAGRVAESRSGDDARRPRRRGTERRRHSVFAELVGVTALYLALFFLLINDMRRGETASIAWLFARFGSHEVTAATNDALLVVGHGHRPILAYISPSCSSLMGILALGALAFTVLRSRRAHTLGAYLCAASLLFMANIARMAASCLAGIWFGQGALVLFHDWVGTVWNFIATLFGFLLLLYLALPTLERSEQDRTGRHSSNRPVEWARKGLGYAAPILARPRPHRPTITGWVVRHLTPDRVKRSLSRRRESRRIDYRVGYLASDQRLVALRNLAGDGLSVHGATFVAVARHEQSQEVIDALVGLILEQPDGAFMDAQTATLWCWARAWTLGAKGPGETPRAIPDAVQHHLLPRFLTRIQRARMRSWKRAEEREPTQRAELLCRLAEEGLGFNAPPLIAAVSVESDPTVLDALAEAIASRQWEPVTGSGVAVLKLWARAWTMARRTRDTRTGADPAADRASVATQSRTDEETRERTGSSQRDSIARVVAVTGAGGPAGISVIKALREAGHRVIAIDADPLAAGLRLPGVNPLVIPYADDPAFARALVDGLAERHAEALICTVAEEYAPLAKCAPELDGLGCKTWLPDQAAVETCLDKAAFAHCMREHDIAHPPTATSIHGSRFIPGAWVVKPRRGRGSRGVVTLEHPREVRRAMRKDSGLIVQSRLLGEEFTADVLVDRDGQLVTCVPRWRLVVSSGISVRGETFDSDAVTLLCAETLAAVGLTGVANIQGFVDPSGGVAVVEVNPRFSGGLSLTVASGADVVGAYLEGILHPDRWIEEVFFTPGVRMVRYFEEIYEEQDGPMDRDGSRAAGKRAKDPANRRRKKRARR